MLDDLLTPLLTHLVQFFGGSLGHAIVALSLGLRVALLPLTISLARRAWRNQELARALQPELEEIKRRFSSQPERLWKELRELYGKHNYNPLDFPALAGSFLQLPIFAMVYGTIRRALTGSQAYLWIRNLAAPDLVLTFVILCVTGLAAWWMPMASENARTTIVAIQLIITGLIVWKLAAGLGLYWASSSLVSAVQSLWLRYRIANMPQVVNR